MYFYYTKKRDGNQEISARATKSPYIRAVAVCLTLANCYFDGNITTNIERHCAAAIQEKDRMSTFNTMMFLGLLAQAGVALAALSWMAGARKSLRPAAIRRPARRGSR
ncbi:hypothetical protein OL229_02500 [Neisseriaceae bacterium JH1-16]|nr:hypothetical protein [Neisseriaceae bacterium JH1-16]